MTKPVPHRSSVGKGAWRISYDKDDNIMSVELWYEDESEPGKYTHNVLDIKTRGPMT